MQGMVFGRPIPAVLPRQQGAWHQFLFQVLNMADGSKG